MAGVRLHRLALVGLSAALASLVLAAGAWGLARASFSPPPPGGTVRLNVADPGRSSDTAISDDGRYVAFSSSSDVMLPGDSNAVSDVFRRDLTNNTTVLVSAHNGTASTFGTGASVLPAMSADGQVVAFLSQAKDLTGDTYTTTPGVYNVFVRVISTSATLRINASGDVEPNQSAPAVNLAISANGEYVVFESYATNLTTVPVTQTSSGGGPIAHLYLWGPRSGSPTVRMVDVTPGNQACLIQPPYDFSSVAASNPAVSADGRYVAFSSMCQNIVTSPALTQSYARVFRRDMTGASTALISKDTSGNPFFSFGAFVGGISRDGCVISFQSTDSSYVTGDNNGTGDVFVWDCHLGTANQIARVSLANGGSAELNGGSVAGPLSSDGRYVSFSSVATNAVAGLTNDNCDTDSDNLFDEKCSDIYVRDRQTNSTLRVDLTGSGGELSTGAAPLGADAYFALTADGRYLAFASDAPELGVNSANVFRRDRTAGTTTLASVPFKSPEANGASNHPALSPEGGHVAFASTASNLAYGAYTYTQVFVRDLNTGSYRVMNTMGNTQGDGDAGNPAISGDANCWVAFETRADNLIISGTNGISDTNGAQDIFVKQCSGGNPYRVSQQTAFAPPYTVTQTTADSFNPAISRDGTDVAFESEDTQILGPSAGAGTPQLYVFNLNPLHLNASQLMRPSGWLTYSNGSNYHPALSADGQCVTWSSNATNNLPAGNPADQSTYRIYLANLDLTFNQPGITSMVSQESLDADHPAISADCRYLAWVQHDPLTTTYQLVFKDLQGFGLYVLDNNVAPGYAPAISDDGRFVSYCSVDPGTSNYAVYSYDLALRQRWLVSRTAGSAVPNGDSCRYDRGPAPSADGRFVVFSSAANNLVASDTNGVADIFGSTISATVLPSIAFPTAPITITRGFGVLPIYLTRTGPLGLPASVRVFFTSPDSSIDLNTGFAIASQVVTFTAGQASAPLIAYIPAVNGGDPLTGTVRFWLWDVVTATLGAPASYDLRIMNEAPGPINGLAAASSSPTLLGSPTTLTASVAGPFYMNFNWSFGDATTGYGGSLRHTYPAAGVYTATVTATDGGFTSTASTRVTIVNSISIEHKLFLPLVRR